MKTWMRSSSLRLALIGLSLLLPASSRAEIGTIDTVPAATLLLPYFEVDFNDSGGVTTQIELLNALAVPALVNVVLWTDLSVPTLSFNVYLTGYDVAVIDLGSLFTTGSLPGSSPLSPDGAFSESDNPAWCCQPGTSSCSGILPPGSLPGALLAHLQAAHTGQMQPNGLCSGQDLGDGIARGYVTIDNVNQCTLLFPGDSGYFVDDGLGVASNVNQLLGSFRFIDVDDNLAQGDVMVHVEASSTDPRTAPGRYTFYARYSQGADNREPLGTTYLARYLNSEAATTDLIVWRDSKVQQSAFTCSSPPAWYPLGQARLVAFDDEENPVVLDETPFPAETNRVAVGGAALPTPYSAGALYANLSWATGAIPELDPIAQAWVTVIQSASGLFSMGLHAFQLDNAASAPRIILPLCNGSPDPAACP